jgi:hypothetical protein
MLPKRLEAKTDWRLRVGFCWSAPDGSAMKQTSSLRSVSPQLGPSEAKVIVYVPRHRTFEALFPYLKSRRVFPKASALSMTHHHTRCGPCRTCSKLDLHGFARRSLVRDAPFSVPVSDAAAARPVRRVGAASAGRLRRQA